MEQVIDLGGTLGDLNITKSARFLRDNNGL